MQTLSQILIYAVVGFAEMFLVAQRTRLLASNKNFHASLVVFVENIVTLFIFFHLINNLNNNWSVGVSYALGSSLGTMIKLERG